MIYSSLHVISQIMRLLQVYLDLHGARELLGEEIIVTTAIANTLQSTDYRQNIIVRWGY